MSYPIANIIPITVNISPSGLGTANFASALAVAPTAELPADFNPDTLRTYLSLKQVSEDFANTTETYAMASKWFGSTPAVYQLQVWGRNKADADIVTTLTKAFDKTWWYWTFVDKSTLADTAQVLTVAKFAEDNNVFFPNSQVGTSAEAIRAGTADNIAEQLTTLGYRKTYTVSHATDPYAAIALAKQFAAVNYAGTNTTITGEYKKSPGVAAEDLSGTAYTNMRKDTVRCVYYSTLDLQGSTDVGRWMNTYTHSAYGETIDDVVNLDAFVNSGRVAGYNAIAGTTTKLPQDPVGQAVILGAFRTTGAQFITNGYLGPRNYTNPDNGNTEYTTGFEMLTVANDILNLTAAQRDNHEAYPVNVRLFKAGSIWTVDLTVNVY